MTFNLKINPQILIGLIAIFFLHGCASTKVLNMWKSEPTGIQAFKENKIFVVARTGSTQARIVLEQEIVAQLAARGIKSMPSYLKFPMVNPEKELSEERKGEIIELLESEGFGGIIMTSVLDKKQTTSTSQNWIYVGGSFSNYYPSYYGGFYDCYSRPYAYGSYYSAYMPTSTTTTVNTTYVVETVAYNLLAKDEEKLVFVVTSSIDNPYDLENSAHEFVAILAKNLEK
jgi:hypothetical protein